MIDLDFIERLIKVLDESGLDSLELERGGTRVRLAKTPDASGAPMSFLAPAGPSPASAAAPAPEAAEAKGAVSESAGKPADTSKLIDVTAPMVGTFYQAPAPDAPAYADVGTKVKPGDALCIIEAMKLMNELESEVSGTVVEVCVENAQPVEYGQVLFRVDPG